MTLHYSANTNHLLRAPSCPQAAESMRTEHYKHYKYYKQYCKHHYKQRCNDGQHLWFARRHFFGGPTRPESLAPASDLAPAPHNELPMFKTSQDLMRCAPLRRLRLSVATCVVCGRLVCCSLNQEHVCDLVRNEGLRASPLHGRRGQGKP